MRLISKIVLIAIALTGMLGCQSQVLSHQESDILKLDEDFRLAKLNQDIPALDKILADEFYEMNQNGNGRNKTETMELFEYFKLESLETESSEVQFANGTAVVRGSQLEKNYSGEDRMLYQRVYVKRDGQWQLFASFQFRNPQRTVGQFPEQTKREANESMSEQEKHHTSLFELTGEWWHGPAERTRHTTLVLCPCNKVC